MLHHDDVSIEETLLATKDSDLPVLWFWPNVDAGSDGTSAGIRAFREKHELHQFHFFKNMEPDDFLKVLLGSSMLIGNSSVGIRECSFLKVPVINIGSRQNRRERGSNVIDVGYDQLEIRDSIRFWLENPRPEVSYIYGRGDAGESIASLLSNVPLRFHKTITY